MIIGWRVWRYSNGYLASLASSYDWRSGTNRADKAPLIDDQPNIMYGLYAYNDSSVLIRELYFQRYRLLIIGTIIGWGNYVEHEYGYRFEYARIHSLYGWYFRYSDALAGAFDRPSDNAERSYRIMTIDEITKNPEFTFAYKLNRVMTTDAVEHNYGVKFYTGVPFLFVP